MVLLNYLIIFLASSVVLVVISLYIWLKRTDISPNAVLTDDELFFLDSNKKKFLFPKPFERTSAVYLSVVIPAYNEEKRLDAMMEDTMKYLLKREGRDRDFTWEIVIVSDGSEDKTSEIVLKWAQKYQSKNIRLLQLLLNRGKGGAVKRGMMVSRGRYLLMADADGATRFSDFDKVEKALLGIENNGYGVAVGSRAHLQGEAESKRSFFRNVLMWGFHLVVKWIGGVHTIRDTQCGFKLFSRDAARVVFSNLHLSRWAFDVELLWLAQQHNIRIAEVQVHWREIAGSHLEQEDTRLVSLQMFKDLVRVRFSYLFGIWNVRK